MVSIRFRIGTWLSVPYRHVFVVFTLSEILLDEPNDYTCEMSAARIEFLYDLINSVQQL